MNIKYPLPIEDAQYLDNRIPYNTISDIEISKYVLQFYLPDHIIAKIKRFCGNWLFSLVIEKQIMSNEIINQLWPDCTPDEKYKILENQKLSGNIIRKIVALKNPIYIEYITAYQEIYSLQIYLDIVRFLGDNNVMISCHEPRIIRNILTHEIIDEWQNLSYDIKKKILIKGKGSFLHKSYTDEIWPTLNEYEKREYIINNNPMHISKKELIELIDTDRIATIYILNNIIFDPSDISIIWNKILNSSGDNYNKCISSFILCQNIKNYFIKENIDRIPTDTILDLIKYRNLNEEMIDYLINRSDLDSRILSEIIKYQKLSDDQINDIYNRYPIYQQDILEFQKLYASREYLPYVEPSNSYDNTNYIQTPSIEHHINKYPYIKEYTRTEL